MASWRATRMPVGSIGRRPGLSVRSRTLLDAPRRLRQTAPTSTAPRPLPASDAPPSPGLDRGLIAAGLAVCAALVLRIAVIELPKLDSDGLHTQMLVQDLIERRGDVVWQCTTNFYFFPALALVAVGEALFDDLGLVHVTAFALQALGVLAAGIVYARVATPRLRPREWLLAATALTTLYLCAALAWPLLSHTAFMPTSHGMHFPVAILVLAAFLAAETRPAWPSTAAFLLLGSLLLLSDVIFVAWLFAPLAVASFAAWALARRDLRRLLRAGLLIGVPVALSALGKLALEATGRFDRRTRSGGGSPQEILAGFQEFLANLPRIEGAGALGLVSALTLLSAVALLLAARRRGVRDALSRGLGHRGGARLPWAAAFTAAGVVVSLAAPLLTGAWEGRGSARYFANLAFLPALWASHAALAAGALLRAGALRAFALACIALGAAGALGGGERPSLAALRTPYPARVAALDALAEAHGLRFGLADYWLANQVRALSRRGLRVVAVQPSLRPYLWSASADVYFETPSYDFVILEDISREVVERRLGPPREVLWAGPLEVWRYDREADARRFDWFHQEALDAVRRRGLLLREAWLRPPGP
jgi:hypothetical protein